MAGQGEHPVSGMPASMSGGAAEVLIRDRGTIGRITLNRPGAINALTMGMLQAIGDALTAWTDDPAICGVLVDGAGARGLCAGGDIRFLHDAVRGGRPEAADAFFRTEYALNARIAGFGKPYVAIMDGVVMGGGVGVSAHGSVRIVTERTRLAMPEVAIGLLPDIGATWLLAAAPGRFGFHAALTGGPMGAADAMACGLADHHVRSDRLPALIATLETCRDRAGIAAAVAAHASPPGNADMSAGSGWIADCYRHPGLPDILAALRARPVPAARAAAQRIAGQCPMSLAVTLRALREAPALGGLVQCLAQEYRLVTRLTRRADFVEGVRAAVIDKDRNPVWKPAPLAELDRLFAP